MPLPLSTCLSFCFGPEKSTSYFYMRLLFFVPTGTALCVILHPNAAVTVVVVDRAAGGWVSGHLWPGAEQAWNELAADLILTFGSCCPRARCVAMQNSLYGVWWSVFVIFSSHHFPAGQSCQLFFLFRLHIKLFFSKVGFAALEDFLNPFVPFLFYFSIFLFAYFFTFFKCRCVVTTRTKLANGRFIVRTRRISTASWLVNDLSCDSFFPIISSGETKKKKCFTALRVALNELNLSKCRERFKRNKSVKMSRNVIEIFIWFSHRRFTRIGRNSAARSSKWPRPIWSTWASLSSPTRSRMSATTR